MLLNFFNKYYSDDFQKQHDDKIYNDDFNKSINNYLLLDTKCICGAKNDQNLFKKDRSRNNFETVICKSCGLARVKKYFKREDIISIYKNSYNNQRSQKNSEELYNFQSNLETVSENWNLIEEHVNLSDLNKLDIIDIGGASGGFLNKYRKIHNCTLADYDKSWLEYANSKNINTVNGGLDEILLLNKKFDLILMTHVIEHMSDLDSELKNLKKICKKGTTKVFFEFPGIDSLKIGRRSGNFLGDVVIYHYHYFASYTFQNIMEKYGFECLYSDSIARMIFQLANDRNHHFVQKNFFKQAYQDINVSSLKLYYFLIIRKITVFLNKNLSIKQYDFLKNILKKIFKPSTYLHKIYNILTYINFYKTSKVYKRIIHLHVPQCGGNSINYYLKLNFGIRFYQFRKNSIRYLKDDLSTNKFILTSHTGIDYLNEKISSKEYFTILSIRNPKNRLLSNYYRNKKLFEAENQNQAFHSLDSFLEERIESKLDNVLVRYLLNKFTYDGNHLNEVITKKDFIIALDNLKLIDKVFNIDNAEADFKELNLKLNIFFPISNFFKLHKNKVSNSNYPSISKYENELLDRLTYYDMQIYHKIENNEL